MTEHKLTEKENYLMAMRGEFPEYLPRWDMFGWGVRSSATAHFTKVLPNGNTVNEFGVESISVPDAEGGSIPVPGKFLLEDITKWRDVIKTPSLEGIDWEAAARRDLKDFDRKNKPVMSHIGGFFLTLVSFMGFENGLCAMYEEPEECQAMLEYLCDYYLEIQRQYIKRGAFLAVNLTDDTATALNPFISMDLYRKILKPVYRRHCEQALNEGLFVTIHNCGRCEDQIGDWFDLGISGWDPAQPVNDLLGIKARYGRKLAIIGGWDSTGPATWPDSSEEELRAELERYVDKLAPGGGFCFAASVMGGSFDERQKKKYGVIREFYETRVRNYYDTH
jgi:hypothetical protein